MLNLANKIKFFLIASMMIISIGSLEAKESSCLSKNFNIKVVENVTLNEVLNQLSDMCNFSIVTKDSFSKTTLAEQLSSINIKDMSLSDIFEVLLSEKNLNYEFSNNILKISTLKTKTFKIDYITSIREGRAVTKASVDSSPIEIGDSSQNSSGSGDGDDVANQDNIIKTTEKFDFWEKLDAELKAILNNTSESIVAPDPIINQNAGLITVTGTPSQLKRAEAYIAEMQKRLKKQVIIDVSIISVELNNEYKKGVDWSKFELGFNSYVGGNASSPSSKVWTNKNNHFTDGFNKSLTIAANLNFSLDGVLNFLETNGNTKVISSPKVTTLNNQQALISVGDNINYRVREETTNSNTLTGQQQITYKQYSVFIGILLNLLPEVSDDNKIMLRVNPSLSGFKYREDDVRNITIREIAPDTIQKKLSTVVHVNSGDTIILGGLIGQTKGKDTNRVPLLADIPILGNAFKSTRDVVKTTELVFVITPRIVDLNDQSITKQSLRDLGFSKSIYE